MVNIMSEDENSVSERDAAAGLLDSLLQVIAEGSRGGVNRTPTHLRLGGLEWSARYAELELETLASIRMLKTKNTRAAARAKQQTKRRGIVKG
jgi:hypothetical protein